ncbi:uncharacterized protein P884DRAFT_273434 [Thermothelomyces heterothallicus CBS 202.75]|uniref:uncharacterized protein n=1 Tax=Thermothelomyces heterothallicus CBS 202.75 TaxID=1149848 RepID=UPI003741EDFF
MRCTDCRRAHIVVGYTTVLHVLEGWFSCRVWIVKLSFSASRFMRPDYVRDAAPRLGHRPTLECTSEPTLSTKCIIILPEIAHSASTAQGTHSPAQGYDSKPRAGSAEQNRYRSWETPEGKRVKTTHMFPLPGFRNVQR